MATIFKSLEQISTDYRVFEKDQVLTHDQLNSLSQYFDDQTRLTRISLLGVGIVCGLNVRLEQNTVKVGKGVGVTTDGDLLFLEAEKTFDQFKAYDESNPVYSPLYSEGTLIPVYELVGQGTTDARAASLTQFETQTGKSLNAMVAVLFVESYEKDEDLCSGTDCDNLGKTCIHTTKVLLIEKTSVNLLTPPMDTPGQTAAALNPIVADRPLITSSVQSFSQLAQVYRTVCGTIHRQLVTELPKLYPSGTAFLSEVFPADPGPTWVSTLTTINTSTFGPNNNTGIQYYYDFLKDLVETYNHIRDLLFGEHTVCCPAPEGFPKHLLLGNLVPGSDATENRTGFYPSPVVSQTLDELQHAKFLVRKLNALIQNFQVSVAANAPIRITPSFLEDHSLEERAIPYYYRMTASLPVYSNWNFCLSRRGQDKYLYSYHASAYGAQGAAANPLRSQIGRFSFFRVEGHIGKNVSTVVSSIESQIKANNLPFAVKAVMLETDRTKIVIKPGIRYSDLHRFHYVLRQDVSHQLDEVVQFSNTFKQQVENAVTSNMITNSPDDNDGMAVKDIADQQSGTVTNKAAAAQSIINLNYSSYRADPSWKSDINDTMRAAGEFKFNLGKVVKTEFTTPFDSLIANTHVNWLDWLDSVIQAKNDKEDEKLLFGNFLSQHPGIEHFGGVQRGGTFIVVYDSSNTVVADLMLPYYCCETVDEEAPEPVLPKPPVRPPFVIDNGIKIGPSLDKFVKTKINLFETDFNKTLQTKFDLQKDSIKESFTLLGTAIGKSPGVTVGAGTAEKFQDPILGLKVQEMETKQKEVETLKQKAADPTLTDANRKLYEAQIKDAEMALAKSVEGTTKYISDSGTDVTVGSEGNTAILSVSSSVGVLTQPDAITSAKTGITNVINTTKNTTLKVGLSTLIGR